MTTLHSSSNPYISYWCNRLWVLVFILFALPGVSLAQHGKPLHFTVEDGLPSNTVYFLFEDREGYIWFATDQGLARFDGNEFDVFTRQDGLSDNEIFSIVEDKVGRLWFATSNGIPSFYEDGKFFNPTTFPALKQLDIGGYIQEISVNEAGDVYFLGQFSGLYCLTPEGNVRDFSHRYGRGIAALYHHDSVVYKVFSRKGMMVPLDSSAVAVDLKAVSLTRARSSGNKAMYWAQDSIFISVSIGSADVYFFNVNTKRQLDSAFLVVPDTARLNHGTFMVEDQTIWLVEDDGIYAYSITGDQEFGYLPTVSYIEGNPTFVHRDFTDNLWVSTLDAGAYLYLTPRVSSLYFNGQPEGTTLLSTLSHPKYGQLLLFSNGDLFGWRLGTLRFLNHLPIMYSLTHSIYPSLHPNRVWVSGKNGFFLVDLGNQVYDLGSFGTEVFETPSGILLGSSAWSQYYPFDSSVSVEELQSSFIKQYQTVEMRIMTVPERTLENRIWSVMSYSPDTILFGFQKGVGIVEVNSGRLSILSDPQLPRSVRGMKSYQSPSQDKSWYWMAGDEFMMAWTKEGDSLRVPQSLLRSNKIDQILPVGDTLVFAASDQGLLHFEVDYDSVQLQYLGATTEVQGLPSNLVDQIAIVEDSLWILTRKGAVVASIKDIISVEDDRLKAPRVKSLWVNTVPYPVNSVISLSPGKKTVRLEVGPMQLVNLGKAVFQYKLATESNWASINSNELQFIGLGSGEHTIKVRTVGERGAVSEATVVQIFIAPQWWQLPWVWGVLVLLLVVAVYWIVRWRNRVITRRAHASVRMAQMELKALKAQMNPHFIFNALSSIQRFILASDTQQANEYLTKYSRLTRLVLNHSDKTFVTLSDEIQLLEYYIDLERLRLSEGFDYEVLVAEDVNPDQLEIPPLLLQVFVENAIWHGISPLDRPGKLVLMFERVGVQLRITVRDNGIGRKAAAIRNPRQGESKGGQLSIDKLAMLNRTVYQGRASLRILDRTDDVGHALGTDVIFEVPIEF